LEEGRGAIRFSKPTLPQRPRGLKASLREEFWRERPRAKALG
jgi:hypothetical protein